MYQRYLARSIENKKGGKSPALKYQVYAPKVARKCLYSKE
ncbi:Uncharacterised protein [Serratia plymuthica]|nr:Uncharacterised protein [Serratia plymuthica]